MVRQPSSRPSGNELANKHSGIDEQHEGNVIPHEALRRLSQDATDRLNLFWSPISIASVIIFMTLLIKTFCDDGDDLNPFRTAGARS